MAEGAVHVAVHDQGRQRRGVAQELGSILTYLDTALGATLYAHGLGLCGRGFRADLRPNGHVDSWMALPPPDSTGDGLDNCGWLLDSGWRPVPQPSIGLWDAMRATPT